MTTLRDVLQPEWSRAGLEQAGQAPPAAAAAGDLLVRAAAVLRDQGIVPEATAHALFVPGRIEVLGKHTDYAGGRSLVAASEQGFALVVRPRNDAVVRAWDVAGDEGYMGRLDGASAPLRAAHWSGYLVAVMERLRRNFAHCRRGCDLAFVSNLPPAAGMSSSSALVVAFFLAMLRTNELEREPAFQANVRRVEDLAGYAATMENGQTFGTLAGAAGVGTFGGSEDHTAILGCCPGRLSQYRYCPVQPERQVSVSDADVFVIAASGVVAEKTGNARERYNAASQLAGRVAAYWRERTGRDEPHLGAVAASGPETVAQLRALLADVTGAEGAALRDRCEHFLAESEEIIPAAVDALARTDRAAFGRQVDRSQELAETRLKNQVPETVFLARMARQLGAAAASAFGAGFGGSVWALVTAAEAEAFTAQWRQAYAGAFPEPAARARFFCTRPGSAAVELGVSGGLLAGDSGGGR